MKWLVTSCHIGEMIRKKERKKLRSILAFLLAYRLPLMIDVDIFTTTFCVMTDGMGIKAAHRTGAVLAIPSVLDR